MLVVVLAMLAILVVAAVVIAAAAPDERRGLRADSDAEGLLPALEREPAGRSGRH